MANLALQSGTLSWLRSLLLEQRGIVKTLLGRMSFLGSPGSMTPPVFSKFLQMLKQIAAEKEHEKDLISQIETIECRHRAQRRGRKLKSAVPARRPAEQSAVAEQQPESSGSGWLMALALYVLMVQKPQLRK